MREYRCLVDDTNILEFNPFRIVCHYIMTACQAKKITYFYVEAILASNYVFQREFRNLANNYKI